MQAAIRAKSGQFCFGSDLTVKEPMGMAETAGWGWQKNNKIVVALVRRAYNSQDN